MDNSIIGNQITKFRKAAGLTQEELGRAVGVSTQAVSRWECGGAPDVTLLPAIADKLAVPIDALFGRESGELRDIAHTLQIWGCSLLKDRLFRELNRNLWSCLLSTMTNHVAISYPTSCFTTSSYPDIMNCSMFGSDYGYYFGVAGEDFGFSTLCHKPAEGYGDYLPDPEKARAFFTLLARPGCLETMAYLLRQSESYYAVDVLAKGVGIPEKEMSVLMEELSRTSMVNSIEVGTLRGKEKVYCLNPSRGYGFLSLSFLARCLAQESINFIMWEDRQKPILEEQ